MGQKKMTTTAKKSRKEAKSAFFNRELSWLAFNRRVLEQAEDDRYPLLERLRFLSFVSSNLDEFYEIRVSGLIQQVESGITTPGIDGLGPKEQLRRVQSVTGSLVKEQYACWQEQIVPGLAEKGIFFKTRKELTRREHLWLRAYFEEQIQPVNERLGVIAIPCHATTVTGTRQGSRKSTGQHALDQLPPQSRPHRSCLELPAKEFAKKAARLPAQLRLRQWMQPQNTHSSSKGIRQLGHQQHICRSRQDKAPRFAPGVHCRLQ